MNRPGRLGQNQAQTRPLQGQNLNKAEKQEAQQQAKNRTSSADAARIASQAGFQRIGAKKTGKGFNIGDPSSQPYALPDDELDPDVWSQERLEDAQGSLALAGSQFGEAAQGVGGEASLGAVVVGSSYMPTEEDLEEMEDLAKRSPPKPMPMLDEMSHSISAFFNIENLDEVPIGHKVLAAGLVVAGEPDSVEVEDGKLKENQLAGGLEKVTKRGNQAVAEAQRMNKGINEKLNVQRTFMFKR